MACRLKDMRLWRNWQTRTFEGRVGNRMGSSPINRTIGIRMLKGILILIKHKNKGP